MTQIQLKDPADNIEFGMSWTGLGVLTLTTVVHSVPADSGLTIAGESNTTLTSQVRLSGAIHGKLYQITGTATLSNGRTLVRSFPLRIFKQ